MRGKHAARNPHRARNVTIGILMVAWVAGMLGFEALVGFLIFILALFAVAPMFMGEWRSSS